MSAVSDDQRYLARLVALEVAHYSNAARFESCQGAIIETLERGVSPDVVVTLQGDEHFNPYTGPLIGIAMGACSAPDGPYGMTPAHSILLELLIKHGANPLNGKDPALNEEFIRLKPERTITLVRAIDSREHRGDGKMRGDDGGNIFHLICANKPGSVAYYCDPKQDGQRPYIQCGSRWLSEQRASDGFTPIKVAAWQLDRCDPIKRNPIMEGIQELTHTHLKKGLASLLMKPLDETGTIAEMILSKPWQSEQWKPIRQRLAIEWEAHCMMRNTPAANGRNSGRMRL